MGIFALFRVFREIIGFPGLCLKLIPMEQRTMNAKKPICFLQHKADVFRFRGNIFLEKKISLQHRILENEKFQSQCQVSLSCQACLHLNF